jgi:hypothetical protein
MIQGLSCQDFFKYTSWIVIFAITTFYPISFPDDPCRENKPDKDLTEHATIKTGREMQPSFFKRMIRYRLFVTFEDTNTEIFFFTGFECKKEAVSMVLADIGKSALY